MSQWALDKCTDYKTVRLYSLGKLFSTELTGLAKTGRPTSVVRCFMIGNSHLYEQHVNTSKKLPRRTNPREYPLMSLYTLGSLNHAYALFTCPAWAARVAREKARDNTRAVAIIWDMHVFFQSADRM